MKSLTKSVLLASVLLSIGARLVVAGERNEASPLSISITTPHDTVSVGSDVRVEIALTNRSTRTIMVEVGGGILPYKVNVHGSDMNLSPETERGRKLRDQQKEKDRRGAVSGKVGSSLKPGETITSEIIVSDLYDMHHPDLYTIQLSRKSGAEELKSNALSVTVTP